MLSDSELESARIHGVFSSALAAEEAVYRLNLKQRFQGEWDLLLSFGCLQMLSLDSNQVADVPESIGNLTQLRSLGLGDNQLTDVPESIGNLTQLQTLDLRSNQLTDLPESIGNLTQLQWLNLRGNPIPVQRRAAIQALLPNTVIMW